MTLYMGLLRIGMNALSMIEPRHRPALIARLEACHLAEQLDAAESREVFRDLPGPHAIRCDENPSGAMPSDNLVEEPLALTKPTSFAEFYHSLPMQTDQDKVLAAVYWLTTGDDEGSRVRGGQINDLLKSIGCGVANVTLQLRRLRKSEPALVVRLRDNTKQARWDYKITAIGKRDVEEKMRGKRLQ